MSDDETRKIQQDFNRLAQFEQPRWNHNNHYHDFLLRQLPERCEKILEIGCGTGEFSRRLADRADRVIAIDLSPNMIDRAKHHCRNYHNIDFQTADVMDWEFPELFDAIVSIATLHHLPVEHLLPRLKTALKSGGKLIVLDLITHEDILESFRDGIAIPLNWIFQMFKNPRSKPNPEAIAAWKEHAKTDRYLTRSQAQEIYGTLLKGASIKKHLFWRYSAIWEKP